MRRKHCFLLSMLFAAGCFTPEIEPRGVYPFESGAVETSTGSQTVETTGIDPHDGSDESGSESEGDATTDVGSTTGADTQPPTIVASSPQDGGVAIASDASISITFSEPMHRASTQAAWVSPDIGGATLSWSEDDTVLTIVPSVPFEYATGSDVASVVARVYSFTLDITATDKAGNALDAPLRTTFSTLRRIELTLAPIDALTGMTYSGGSINTTNIYIGDVSTNTQQKGVLSFELPELPRDAELARADVHADQTICGGEPYGVLPSLGEVHILDIEFETNWDAWEAENIADLGVFADDAALETKSFDAAQAVLADYAAGLENTQFRLEFPVATNGNDVLDRCTFNKPMVGMDLAYLIE